MSLENENAVSVSRKRLSMRIDVWKADKASAYKVKRKSPIILGAVTTSDYYLV